jgi:hypothetical protein
LGKERTKFQKDILDPLFSVSAPIYELTKYSVHKILVDGRDILVVPKSMEKQKFQEKAGGAGEIPTFLDGLLQYMGQNFVIATAP